MIPDALNPSVLFSEHGAFAQIFPNFEPRPQQEQMAQAVEEALAKSHHLLVEAGTGTGKSLAYLAPAAIWAMAGKRRVVVSTHTKVLQNQLIKKDIPLLQQAIGAKFRAEPVFGQENYLCRRRMNATISHGLFDTPTQAEEIDAILEWALTSNGVLVDYPGPLDSRTLAKIGRSSDSCRYDECPHRDECFYFAARQRWQQAQLLVINHHLYFANSEVNDHLLPAFDAVIFDEAHRLEDVAADYFGVDVSDTGLDRLFNSVHNPKYRRGILTRAHCPSGMHHHIDDVLRACREASEEFFRAVQARVPASANRARIREAGIADNTLVQPLNQLQSVLKELAGDQDDEDVAGEIQSLMKTAERQQLALENVLSTKDKNSAYWVEAGGEGRGARGGRRAPSVHLRSAMIDVSDLFRNGVLEKRGCVILTSATLTTGRDFHFIVDRLGAQSAKTLLLDSPFDFTQQAVLYVDSRLPPPTNSDAFVTAAAAAIGEILHLSQGRALVLFTSYDMLQKTYDLVARHPTSNIQHPTPLLPFRFFAQGEAPTFELLKAFKEDISSVLFATQSFWEGIDVPGEALSCLIIVRLPFEVPDDPRLEGIAEALRAEGREPFMEYQLPQAVLRFRQGFGRLIRHKTDRGVVCVLDNRIVRKQYGRAFIVSLPPGIPLVQNVNHIARFLRTTDAAPKGDDH
jgi:ATP-dependent DNA helicase DinG